MPEKNKVLSPLPQPRQCLAFLKIRYLCALAGVSLLSSCADGNNQPIGVQEQIEVGEQLMLAGQYESAFSVLDGIAEVQSTQPKALMAVGDSFLGANALLRAEAAYRQAGSIGPSHLAEIGLGKVALKRNEAERALYYFNTAIEKDPGNAEAWNGLGVAYDLSHNHTQAQDSYRQALALAPDYVDAVNNLGLSLVLSGNSAAAVESFTLLAESRLDNDTTRANFAIALHMAGYNREAVTMIANLASEGDAEQLFAAIRSYVRKPT